MYTRHENNKTVTETIPALDFIQKLIVHIPEKHFKMLRYYGVYAKHHKQEKKLRKCISAKKTTFPAFYSGLAALHSALFRMRLSLLFRMWYFYVGFRSLPQKNCTI